MTEQHQTDLPIVLYFSASWCGPCKAMAPTIEAAAEKYSGKVEIIKVDIEESPDSAKQYDIRAVPTFYLVKDGAKLGVKTGAMSAADFDAFVEPAL